MKNVQVIDDALNCLFEIYASSDQDFEVIFPGGCDIEFADDLVQRVGEGKAADILDRLWSSPREKRDVQGIHGTLFYGEANKKRKPFFPTKKEAEMVALPETGK
jgi:hypothetical protein